MSEIFMIQKKKLPYGKKYGRGAAHIRPEGEIDVTVVLNYVWVPITFCRSHIQCRIMAGYFQLG